MYIYYSLSILEYFILIYFQKVECNVIRIWLNCQCEELSREFHILQFEKL